MIITVSIMAGAAALSAMPHIRTSTLLMVVAGFVIVVISAGLISLGPSEEAEGAEGGFQEPKGKPVATVTVEALASLKFQAEDFPTQAGINEIVYVEGGGTHNLLFEEPEFAGFELAVGPPKQDSGKVELEPGRVHDLLQPPRAPRRRDGGHRHRAVRRLVATGVLAVLAVACTSGGSDGAAYREPKGPAQETASFAGGNYYFEPDPGRLPAGINEVELVGEGGVHTLLIDGVDSFELRVDGEEKDAKKVRLEPGKYTIYCDIPGHRDGGMEATLVVK